MQPPNIQIDAGTQVRNWLVLNGVEKFVLYLALIIWCVDGLLMQFRGGSIDTAAYAKMLLGAVLVGALGQYYRQSRRSATIASALTCTALMIFFSNAALILNYLILPLQRPSIDPLLIVIDAKLGYSWPAIVAFAAENPVINVVTKYAYMTTMPQVTLLIVVLGLSGRTQWLHRLMLMICITTIVLIAFWAAFPSHGPAAFFELSPEVLAAASPLVKPEYGKLMLAMAVEGPKLITPADTEGLIAFPSYHSALAFICMFCAWGVRPLFPIFVVINLAILPGTLIHGGHHLVDVPAGFALFLFGVWAAHQVLKMNAATAKND